MAEGLKLISAIKEGASLHKSTSGHEWIICFICASNVRFHLALADTICFRLTHWHWNDDQRIVFFHKDKACCDISRIGPQMAIKHTDIHAALMDKRKQPINSHVKPALSRHNWTTHASQYNLRYYFSK